MQDEVMLKRLVLVKRLYLEGVDKAAHRHNYTDQILSVINLFLAIETLMGAVILEVDQQPDAPIGTKGYVGKPPSRDQVSKFKLGEPHNFDQLFNQVVAILRNSGNLGEDEQLFKWDALGRLQKARNEAQHGAKAPHPNDLPELVATAKEFIECVLGLDFFKQSTSLAEISLANLIEDEVLRQYVEHAEAALAQGQQETCALLTRVAFLLGRLKRRYDWWKDREGRLSDDYDASRTISNDWGFRVLDARDTRLLSNMMFQVIKLPVLFDNWILGLDIMDRSRLDQLTPRLVRYPEDMRDIPPSDEVIVVSLLDELRSGKGQWAGPHFSRTPSKEDCLWIIDYTTETLLRWQREHGDRFAAVDSKYLDALPELKEGINR